MLIINFSKKKKGFPKFKSKKDRNMSFASDHRGCKINFETHKINIGKYCKNIKVVIDREFNRIPKTFTFSKNCSE